MGILSFLTGNTSAVEKVVDAGISGLDKLVFTEEEKADYHRELQKLHLKFVEISASESTAQSISRRLICLPVVYSWLAMIFLNAGFTVFLPDLNSDILMQSISYMNTPALASIGFYTGRHIVSELRKPKG